MTLSKQYAALAKNILTPCYYMYPFIGCADRRAEGVHGEYQAHARDLDARHHADVAEQQLSLIHI